MRTVRTLRAKQARRASGAASQAAADSVAHRQSPGRLAARSIELDSVSHHYGNAAADASNEGETEAETVGVRDRGGFSVRELSLRIGEGESMALLGPSGCGKTTLLRLIAGLERPVSGAIRLGDQTVASSTQRNPKWVPPESRRVGMVFQDWALFPHLDVGRNVGYGLPRSERTPERIRSALDLVGLAGFEARLPSTLSGGQQQRVALARALAPRPGVLLLDEPFSNLDTSLRTEVRGEVRRLLIELGITAVFVTHDQDEAFVLGDRVGVICDGRLAQVDTPDGLYRRPVDRFVADFVGTASWLRCDASDGLAYTPLGRLPVNNATGENGHGAASHGTPETVNVMLRPEQLRLVQGTAAKVELVEFYGHDSMVVASLGGTQLRVRCGPDPHVRRGDSVSVEFTGTSVVAFA